MFEWIKVFAKIFASYHHRNGWYFVNGKPFYIKKTKHIHIECEALQKFIYLLTFTKWLFFCILDCDSSGIISRSVRFIFITNNRFACNNYSFYLFFLAHDYGSTFIAQSKENSKQKPTYWNWKRLGLEFKTLSPIMTHKNINYSFSHLIGFLFLNSQRVGRKVVKFISSKSHCSD